MSLRCFGQGCLILDLDKCLDYTTVIKNAATVRDKERRPKCSYIACGGWGIVSLEVHPFQIPILLWDKISKGKIHSLAVGAKDRNKLYWHSKLDVVARPLEMTVSPIAAPIDRLQANTACYLVILPANYLERLGYSTTDLNALVSFRISDWRGEGGLLKATQWGWQSVRSCWNHIKNILAE